MKFFIAGDTTIPAEAPRIPTALALGVCQTERNATSIAIAAGQQLCELREYAERSGITYPLLADEDRSVIKSYGVYHWFGLAFAHNLIYNILRPAGFFINKLGYSLYN